MTDPTDEEREALDQIIRDADGWWPEAREAILATFRRQGAIADAQRLFEDDEFVVRIARATGIRTWADSADVWHVDETNVDQVKAIDDAVRDRAVESLREKLTEAFADYAAADRSEQ
jgi:hypothetical protein